MTAMNDDSSTTKRGAIVLKLTLALLLLAGIGFAILQFNLAGVIQSALQWVKDLGTVGAIAFVGIYILATVLLLPGSVITLGGGALYGVVAGSIYVFAGATLGATLAFLIGRYLARDWVANRLTGNAKFQAIDRAIAHEGLKIVILTRLSPIFPFNLLNYALGLTDVSLKDYLLGFIGMIPGTVMYVYFGSLAGSLAALSTTPSTAPTGQAQTLQWLLRLVGLLATIAVTVFITQIARRALNERIE